VCSFRAGKTNFPIPPDLICGYILYTQARGSIRQTVQSIGTPAQLNYAIFR